MPIPGRVRREILIQAQQILQEIDEQEDLLDLFQNFDQPAYQAWYDGQFVDEKQYLSELEKEYGVVVHFHNAMVALVKLKRVSMPRAFEILRAEQTAYANGGAAQRRRIEEDRLKREQYIRADLQLTAGEVVDSENSAAMSGFSSATPPATSSARANSAAASALVAVEGEQLKLVYRKLVRRLHPDLQGPDSDAGELRWQKRIWNLLLQARQRGDVREIEHLYKVTLLRQMDFAGLSIDEAHEVHAWLKKELERLTSETWRARQNPAWGFSKIADLRPLALRSRQVLCNEIQQREEELNELKTLHSEIEVESYKRPAPKRRRAPRPPAGQLSLFE